MLFTGIQNTNLFLLKKEKYAHGTLKIHTKKSVPQKYTKSTFTNWYLYTVKYKIELCFGANKRYSYPPDFVYDTYFCNVIRTLKCEM